MFKPKKTKYKKYQKGRLKSNSCSLLHLTFGCYGLKSLESGRITSWQIESLRQNINRKIKKSGKIWINIFPDIPITSKPSEIRMGKGKGNVDYWIAKVSPGQILFEVIGRDSQYSNLIVDALKSGSNKLPVKTLIVRR